MDNCAKNYSVFLLSLSLFTLLLHGSENEVYLLTGGK